MKVPLNWVRQYTDIKIKDEELISKIFTQLGAVEHIEDLNKKYEKILIAEIVEKKDHPDSDKLGIYQANIGKKELIQVVAGDRSLEVGDKVAFLPVGTKVPFNAHPEKDDNVISKVVLRGVESNGMFASSKELDLGADHSHVLKLDKDLKAGAIFAKEFKLDDIVLEIENKALANRGDCFGILGIAREVSGIEGLKFESPDWFSNPKAPQIDKKKELVVINNAAANCPRYMAVIIDNINIAPSPMWMQVLLCEVGIKPINNVVDITNYLMALTSQPMHAFDWNKVIAKDGGKKATIMVRPAKNGAKMLGINNKVMELDDSMTVICDSRNPIALGGIVGGADTEIDENTKSIILECANFNRNCTRKTSWKLGVTTDAATRFTKAIDPNICLPVMYQALNLLYEFANGTVVSEIIDDYQLPSAPKNILISIKKVNALLGVTLSIEDVEKILTNIEYEVSKIDGNLSVTPPLNRLDVNIPEDVYEDIARLFGFNDITVTLPTRSIRPTDENKIITIKDEIRDIFSGNGANEILTYNFVGKSLIKSCNLDISSSFHIKNALSPDLEYMRSSLLPSILTKSQENINRGYINTSLFEINVTHNKSVCDKKGLPIEQWTLACVVVNEDDRYEGNPYYDSKVYVEQIARSLNLRRLTYTLLADTDISKLPTWISYSSKMYNPNSSAIISYEIEKKTFFIGVVGELTSKIKKGFKLGKRASGFEIGISEVLGSISPVSKYSEPSRFPKITQDLCFIISKDVLFSDIKAEIGMILKSTGMYFEIEVIDIYSSPKDTQNKQITFRISLQSREKAIESIEYDSSKKKIIYLLKEKFKAELI
ncbi:phenylalanine--tRNA ligase subunit beta [Candidatus Dojkabacteria bacterium]|jgi:phenylalanyl-tRNA synthetase beta chain|nr:phenylalanine--tRNA ligase subunit beta [Candidatus Dojkabacteria bacterium]